MSFLTWLTNFLVSVVKTPITHLLAYFVGKRAGVEDAKNKQMEADLDAIQRAEAARRAVKHDDVSVRNDPYNRDT